MIEYTQICTCYALGKWVCDQLFVMMALSVSKVGIALMYSISFRIMYLELYIVKSARQINVPSLP